MALKVPEDMKRDSQSAPSAVSGGSAMSGGSGSSVSGGGGGGGGVGAGDPFVAAVAMSASHVLWRAWSGADEEFFVSRLEDNGRARSAVVSFGPAWRSGRAKRGTAAAAFVDGAVVYCKSVPYERSFAIEVTDLRGGRQQTLGVDIPRSVDGAVTACVTADAFSRGSVRDGAAAFCFKVSHVRRRGAADAAVSHVLVAADPARGLAACPAVVGIEFR